MGKVTNSLRSHSPESSNSRADKMSGLSKDQRKQVGCGIEASGKKFYKRKRRMFLKNPNNFDKI